MKRKKNSKSWVLPMGKIIGNRFLVFLCAKKKKNRNKKFFFLHLIDFCFIFFLFPKHVWCILLNVVEFWKLISNFSFLLIIFVFFLILNHHHWHVDLKIRPSTTMIMMMLWWWWWWWWKQQGNVSQNIKKPLIELQPNNSQGVSRVICEN